MTELVVNGERHRVGVEPATPLLYVLRDELGLRGVRTGCAIGECGVCTVLADGEAVRSCLMPVSEAEGRAVTTPEGLGGPDSPHPIQQAFLAEQAGQCGYCVNGIIMTVAAALGASEKSAESARNRGFVPAFRMREILDEHLCRCGTHVRLLRAFRRAAGLDNEPTWAIVPGETMEEPAPEDPIGLACSGAGSVVERWIGLSDDGRIEVRPGKVEIGQGLRTAFAQIAAAHLGVPVACVRVATTTTDVSPDQGVTAGSRSIEDGGTALAMAAVALRRLLLDRAAKHLSVTNDQVDLDAQGVTCRSTGSRVSYQELAADGPVTGTIQPTDRPRWDATALGQPVPRDDLRPKLTGAPAYVQDLTLPGMLYARALLPPAYDARPELVDTGSSSGAGGLAAEPVPIDVSGAEGMPGVRRVVQDGRLVVVIAEREHQAIRAVRRLERGVRWRRERPLLATDGRDLMATLRRLPSQPFIARQDSAVDRALAREDRHQDPDEAAHQDPQERGHTRHRATYTKPYQAHGPMGPSAAVALDDGDRLHVWSHTQGVFPLRRELATLLGLDESGLVVEHVDGPGCYGMDGADDAAAIAAIAARAVPGRPVRFQFSMQDEFGWDPTGPAMLADLGAALDTDGRIVAWRHHGLTDAHGPRPDGTGDRLLASWLCADGVTRPWAGPGEPGARNAIPPYDIPAADVVAHHVRGPLRTGPLRALGSYLNVFAAESFMDELAERAGQDPLAFRLAHLPDARARRVLQVAAERAGWEPHVGPSGRGQGLAFARYKDTKAYVAQVADVEVDVETGELAVRRIVVVADAGTIVNADGLRNQLEGGTIQGLSRAMHEELGLGDDGATTRDWTSYPVLHFRHVPRVDVVLVDRRGCPPLGAGESATPPVPAAVANAIDDAVGIRVRDLPLTPDRLRQRLYDMDDHELARVRV